MLIHPRLFHNILVITGTGQFALLQLCAEKCQDMKAIVEAVSKEFGLWQRQDACLHSEVELAPLALKFW